MELVLTARIWFVELVLVARIWFVELMVIVRTVWMLTLQSIWGANLCSQGVILSEVIQIDLCPLNA